MSGEAQIVAPVGSYCPNEKCPDLGKVDAGHLINFGHTKKGTQRRLRKTCSGTFTVTGGTIFYRQRVVTLLSVGCSRGRPIVVT